MRVRIIRGIAASVCAGALMCGGLVGCSKGDDFDPAWEAEVAQRLPKPATRGTDAFGNAENADIIGRFLSTSVDVFSANTELTAEQCGDAVEALSGQAPAEELFRAASSVRDRALSQLVLNSRQQVGAYLTRCIGNETARGAVEPTAAPGSSREVVRESLRLAAGRYQEVRG